MTAPQASITPIAPDTYRISVPLPPDVFPGGFSFNQYLVVDDKPLLFHTGPRKLFEVVCDQIERVMPVSRRRGGQFFREPYGSQEPALLV